MIDNRSGIPGLTPKAMATASATAAGVAPQITAARPLPLPGEQFQKTAQPATLPNAAVVNAPSAAGLLPGFSRLLERVSAQIASYFYGNRRDTPNEDEREKRRRNDFTHSDLFGAEPRLAESAEAQTGQGQS